MVEEVKEENGQDVSQGKQGNKYSYLVKNILLFSLSGFVPKILAFLLIPIYTSYLTTAEYGISDLISTTVQLLLPVFTLNIQDAVMRFVLDKNSKKEEVFSTALRIILVGILIVTTASTIIGFLDIPNLETSYLLFGVIMFITNALNNATSYFCRGIDKVSVLTVSSIVNSIVTLVFNIVFLVVFEWGLTGFLAANSIGAGVALVINFVGAKLYKYCTRRKAECIKKEMIRFSMPLIFSAIAWWINNASDRYILTWILGVSASGLFAVAYKIPNLLSVFQSIFSRAWSISAVKEFDKDDKDGFIGKMYNMLNFGMLTICSMLIVLNIPIASLLYAKDFFQAWQFAPLLLFSVVLNALSLFLESIFTAVKNTKIVSVSAIIGAVVNIICNILFIWLWGAYGAAIATVLGYLTALAIRHMYLRRYIRIKIKWSRDIAAYILLIGQIALAWLSWKGIIFQFVLFVLLLGLYYKEIKGACVFIKNKFLKRREVESK